jgi:hypothetical protein
MGSIPSTTTPGRPPQNGQSAEHHDPQLNDDAGPFSDAAIEQLVQELGGTLTDLAKLVRQVHQRRLRVVPVSPHAIARWRRDAQGAWERVHVWLVARGVRIVSSPLHPPK